MNNPSHLYCGIFSLLEGWDSPLDTAANTDLLYEPHMIRDCGAIDGMKMGRGNWSTRRKLTQLHSVHHKSRLTKSASNMGCRGGKPATNRLNYGAVSARILQCLSVRNGQFLWRFINKISVINEARLLWLRVMIGYRWIIGFKGRGRTRWHNSRYYPMNRGHAVV
jgi:hypothetical protein